MLRVVAEITERWEEVIADVGLAGPQVKLLRHLLTSGDATMGGIAEHLACDPSVATVAVDRLERRELVIRVPDEADRRVLRMRLSPEGETLVRRVWSQTAEATPRWPARR